MTGRLDVSYAAAWCETGDRLRWLPRLAGAFAEGRLSWDQVRAAAEAATMPTDGAVLTDALGSSAARLERAARRVRMSSRRAGEALRSVRWWWERQGVQWRLSGYLPPEEGAMIERALASTAAPVPRDPENGTYAPCAVRSADALVELAGAGSAAADSPAATLVAHIDTEALGTGVGSSAVESGPVLPDEAARRLACDARAETVLESSDGFVVGIDRAARAIPPRLARQVRPRDPGCRFPDCARTRWVHSITRSIEPTAPPASATW